MGLAVMILLAFGLSISIPIGIILFALGIILAICLKKHRTFGIISGIILIIISIVVAISPIVYIIISLSNYTP